MLLKLIEALVPEPLVLMHPSGHLPKRFCAKRNQYLTPLLLSLNEPRPLQQLEMLRYRIESQVVRFCDIQESCWPVCQLPDNRSPRRMRDGCQHVRELIHLCITPKGVMQNK